MWSKCQIENWNVSWSKCQIYMYGMCRCPLAAKAAEKTAEEAKVTAEALHDDVDSDDEEAMQCEALGNTKIRHIFALSNRDFVTLFSNSGAYFGAGNSNSICHFTFVRRIN
jgi:hypothetical protein